MPPLGSSERDGECAIVEICSTFSSRERADACATRLVRERLAACVQVDGPLSSTYRWRGAVETAEEWRCVCKTTPDRTADCLEAIKAGHDYEVPQAIITRCLGTPDYAAWVRSAVAE